MQHDQTTRMLWLVGLFSVAMGFLEAAVVVYLRLHFHPAGFGFPLAPMPGWVVGVEVAREAATIVMLVCVGWISGRSFLGRFAYFAYAFAVWDIFYYVFLKLVLDWPESLLTTDVLFLIPFPWIAPVLAPVVCSIALIVASIIVVRRESQGSPVTMRPLHWAGIVTGGVVMLISFLLDTGAALRQEMPAPFPWLLFGAGFLVAVIAFFSGLSRVRQPQPADRR